MPPDDGLNDDNAADAAFARHSAKMRSALQRYFLRNGASPVECDDLVQEVFLRIARRGQLRSLDNIEAYIFSVASSVLIDRSRSRRVRRADDHIPFDTDQHGEGVPPPDEQFMAKQALRLTTLILLELPEQTRTIFVLSRLEDLPYREIAARLGCSLSTIEKHMARAVRHLLLRGGELR